MTAIAKTYTTSAEFAEGYLLNVSTSIPDELRLNPTSTGAGLPYLYFPTEAGNRVGIMDTAAGTIHTLVQAAPSPTTGLPRNIAVDAFGEAWVTCPGYTTGGGAAMKVGLIIGGTRCLSNGTPDAAGDYLAPPFTYLSPGIRDRDGDGLLRTFNPLSGLTTLAWPLGTDAAGGVDAQVVDALDDAVLVFQRLAEASPHQMVVIDNDESAWVVAWPNQGGAASKLEEITGQIVQTITPSLGTLAGGYQGVIDAQRRLIALDPLALRLVIYPLDGGTVIQTVLTVRIEAVEVDNAGDIWGVQNNGGSAVQWKWNGSNGALATGWPKALGTVAATSNLDYGICYRAIDNSMWFGCSTKVFRTDLAGTVTATITPGFGRWGMCGVSSDGKVWVLPGGIGNQAIRIDPASNTIDATVTLSGTTSLSLRGTNCTVAGRHVNRPVGMWRVVYDSTYPDAYWQTLTYTKTTPGSSTIAVEYRTSVTELGLQSAAYTTAGASPHDLAGIGGRFMELRVTFERVAGTSDIPILSDIALAGLSERPSGTGPIGHPVGPLGPADPAPFPEDRLLSEEVGQATIAGPADGCAIVAGAVDGQATVGGAESSS